MSDFETVDDRPQTGVFNLRIEKSVPVPTRHLLSGYDWSQWEVGDSVLVEPSRRHTVLKAGKDYLDESGIEDMKFITRTVDGGSRIWLIETS